MQYKLLSVDIDGTLINNKKEVTPKTKERIHKAIEKGVVFTISSGRPVQGVQLITDQLELDVPVITYNGAMVITGESRNIIYSCNMKKGMLCRLKVLKAEGYINCDLVDNKLVNHMNDLLSNIAPLAEQEPVLYTEIEQLIEKGINKIYGTMMLKR